MHAMKSNDSFTFQERRAAIVRQNKALNQQVAKIEVPVSD